MNAIAPDRVAELTKKLAEALGAARLIETELRQVDGPLATLAALRVEGVSDQIETVLDGIPDLAKLVLAIRPT